MEKKDYYKILGIERSASAGEIRKAYRKLARKYHPDINPGNRAAEEKFKEISLAHEVLGDPDKRKRYDEFGEEGLSTGFDPEKARAYRRWQEQSAQTGGFNFAQGGFDDVFGLGGVGEFFHSRGSTEPRARRGEDIETHMEIDFLDAVRGFQTSFTIQRPVSCNACNGTGTKTDGASKQCPECHGSGWKETRRGHMNLRQTCPTCQGSGKPLGNPCASCRGSGRVARPDNVRVNIPPGAETGKRIRVPNKGASGVRGGPAGDLYIIPRIRPHRLFSRSGNDLTMELPITVGEAVRGAAIKVPTPTGTVQVKIPPAAQSGQLLRVKGKGVQGRGESSAGDLYLRLMVRVPQNGVQREAIEKLEEAYGEDIRKDMAL
ncbi:MAG TPA: molecular chaperone DnaJ [Candidatus Binatia bacterium]